MHERDGFMQISTEAVYSLIEEAVVCGVRFRRTSPWPWLVELIRVTVEDFGPEQRASLVREMERGLAYLADARPEWERVAEMVRACG